MKKYCLVYELQCTLSFTEFDFTWSVHFIDAYTCKYMLSTLDFLTVSHLKSIIYNYLYHNSENYKY